MKAYGFDINGEFISEVILQENPLEPGSFFEQPNTTLIAPPNVLENELAIWNGIKWDIKINHSNKIYYHKINRNEKKFEINEELNNDYTEVPPLENQLYQKWNEESNSWIIDLEKKIDFENKERQIQIQKLLSESDYIELPSFIQRKGKEKYDLWMSYREKLRSIYSNHDLPLPNKPE
jgi:hypothetical protein